MLELVIGDVMDVGKAKFLVSLINNCNFSGKVIDFEKDEDKYVLITKEMFNDNRIQYIQYIFNMDSDGVNIIKTIDEESVDYRLRFKKIVNRYFCEVSLGEKKEVMYEFNEDVLCLENASFANVLEMNFYDDSRNRGR